MNYFIYTYIIFVCVHQRVRGGSRECNQHILHRTGYIEIYKLHIKQLLDEVFVISRIIKVEVRVISRSQRLRLITLTETLIILDITKTESNNCFIIHGTNAKTWKSCFCFFTDGKQHEPCKVDIITLGNHALRSYMT